MTNKSEVKVGLSQIEIETDKLNIANPDGAEVILNANPIEPSDLRISDEFIQQLASRTSFIESLKAIDLFKGNDLRQEVSELRQEVAELKQKMEER